MAKPIIVLAYDAATHQFIAKGTHAVPEVPWANWIRGRRGTFPDQCLPNDCLSIKPKRAERLVQRWLARGFEVKWLDAFNVPGRINHGLSIDGITFQLSEYLTRQLPPYR